MDTLVHHWWVWCFMYRQVRMAGRGGGIIGLQPHGSCVVSYFGRFSFTLQICILFHYWRCFMYQHVGVGGCGWRNRRSLSSLVLRYLGWCQWLMELGVAIIIYSNKAKLSKRKYMALNKYANTLNTRAISRTCRPPSTFHHTCKKRKYNIRFRSNANCKEPHKAWCSGGGVAHLPSFRPQ